MTPATARCGVAAEARLRALWLGYAIMLAAVFCRPLLEAARG